MNIKRGDIYYADLSPVIGSEQGGLRPVLIIQNDVGNKYSPTVIAAAITSKMTKKKFTFGCIKSETLEYQRQSGNLTSSQSEKADSSQGVIVGMSRNVQFPMKSNI